MHSLLSRFLQQIWHLQSMRRKWFLWNLQKCKSGSLLLKNESIGTVYCSEVQNIFSSCFSLGCSILPGLWIGFIFFEFFSALATEFCLGGSFRKKNWMINEMIRVLIMYQRSRRNKAKLIVFSSGWLKLIIIVRFGISLEKEKPRKYSSLFSLCDMNTSRHFSQVSGKILWRSIDNTLKDFWGNRPMIK